VAAGRRLGHRCEIVKIHRLEREQWVPGPLPAVFDFFARAENLGRITPAWLNFRIRTPLPIRMEVGTRIEYTIRLTGVPLRWRTRITDWVPDRSFADVQESGPYALWDHRHHFEAIGDGVLVGDRVSYALPFGPIGRAAHALAVRAALAAIFDYRFDRIREILGSREVALGNG
jgi:ligand-binding SRPBCC domain-containing protein